MVERKRVGQESDRVTMAVVEELDDWGYRGKHFILRTDQGRTIQALKERVVELRVGNNLRGECGWRKQRQCGGGWKRVRDLAKTLRATIEYSAQGKSSRSRMWFNG